VNRLLKHRRGAQGEEGPARDDAIRARQLALASMSRPGGRANNQDACGHWRTDERLCCVVADGAGGHGGGDVAAKLVVRHIIDQASLAPLARADEVQDLLIDANAATAAASVRLRQHQGHAQHVVALFVDLTCQEALWGHAGDSRLYVFRDGLDALPYPRPQHRAADGRCRAC
jgi:serine/threonine protein phosphatase PrpC